MKKIIVLLLLIASGLSLIYVVDNMQASIHDVKKRHEAELVSLPGVVSIGIGMGENKKPIIIIGVESDDMKIKSKLPQQLDGYPVSIQTIGKVGAQ